MQGWLWSMTDQLSLLPMLNELHEGKQGTFEALQESVRQNRKGDKVMSLIITKEFVNECKRIGYLKYVALEAVDQLESKDKQIAELKAENERLVKCCKEYDSRQRIDERIKFNGAQQLRATKHVLWFSRAKAYRYIAELLTCFNPDYVRNRKMFTPNNPKQKQMNSLKWAHLMLKIESKCRAKAEEYK